MERRTFIKQSAIAVAGVGILATLPLESRAALYANETYPFELPPLPYGFKDLEPIIDEATMNLHYTKHHQGYVTNLNKALQEAGNTSVSLQQLFNDITAYKPEVRNNAGGHFNHSLFWKVMAPGQKLKMPSGRLSAAIDRDLGGYGKLKENFTKAANAHFGSGWAWLVVNLGGRLEIGTTPNQDNPLMEDAKIKGTPILGLDLWEHAYYLKHQNRRPEYIQNWWNLINWDQVEMNFDTAVDLKK